VAHNVANNIEPISIYKAVRDLTDRVKIADDNERYGAEDNKGRGTRLANLPKSEVRKLISELDEQMRTAAKSLEFEMAAMLRDQILELRQQLNDIDDKTPEWEKIRRMGDEIVEDELAAETAKGERAAAAGDGEPKPAIYRKPSKAKPGRARERSVKTSRR
jgi:UvrB/uvrC motif